MISIWFLFLFYNCTVHCVCLYWLWIPHRYVVLFQHVFCVWPEHWKLEKKNGSSELSSKLSHCIMYICSKSVFFHLQFSNNREKFWEVIFLGKCLQTAKNSFKFWFPNMKVSTEQTSMKCFFIWIQHVQCEWNKSLQTIFSTVKLQFYISISGLEVIIALECVRRNSLHPATRGPP